MSTKPVKDLGWYENIEPEIRPIVKLMRNEGFNTTCSCGHEMYVEFMLLDTSELDRLDNVLFNNGFRTYTIEALLKRDDGHGFSCAVVTFGRK